MKNTILTSLIGIVVALPAMATVGDTTFTAGQSTAAGTCDVGVIGASTGTAQTSAHWTALTYSCAAGTYLPDGDTWSSDSQYTSGNCAQCTAGNYCAGSGNGTFTYSDQSDQGITSCPSGYANSDAGSDAESDCYRACTTGDVAHLKSGGTMTGRYYSGNNNQCAPANDQQCATGYSYTAGGPDLTTAIGVTQAGTGYTSNTSTGSENYSSGMSNTIIANDPMAFAVDYGNGKKISGHGRCSTRGVTNIWYDNGNTFESDHFVDSLTDETGQSRAYYCYCQLDGYTLDNGSMQSLSAPWVFYDDVYAANTCALGCAGQCAQYLRLDDSSSLAFRAAVFGTMQSTPASCDATQYTVSYSCGDGTGTAPVNATATYDSSFSPAANTCTRTGYTFAGWAVSSTNDVKPAGTGFTWNYTENKTLTATWTANSYTCAAGEYLRASDATCQPCLANSYCPTATTYTYNGSDQGLTACGSTYPNSDAGSDSVDDCYRTCAAADVAHLKENGTVTGRYYSNNTNECEPADAQQCTTGYSYTAGVPDPDLTTIIGVSQWGTGYGNKPISGGNGSNASTYGLTENGTWATNYGTGKGIVKGKAQCSTRSATDPWVGSYGAYVLQSDGTTTTLPDSTGGYCYCQLTSYTPDDGSTQSLSTPWVFFFDYSPGGPSECATYCADSCASNLYSIDPNSLAFRAAVFNSIPAGPASCDANTISITWAGANGTYETGSCTYGGGFNTPANAPTKRGHVFTGWTFVGQ